VPFHRLPFPQQGQKNIRGPALSVLLIEHHVRGAVPPRRMDACWELPVWPGKPRMWCWPMPRESTPGVTFEHPLCRRLSNRLWPEQSRASRRRIEPPELEFVEACSQPELGENFSIRIVSFPLGRARLQRPQTRLRRACPLATSAPAIRAHGARRCT